MIAPVKKQLAKGFPIYELKITLCGSKPPIWRRVQVPGGIKLNRLHDVLQVVMGWTDSHLHQFRVGSVIYCLPSDDDFYPGGEQRDERRFRLADIAQREKTSLIYEYDFGDGWEHEVVVEKFWLLILKKSVRFAWMERTPVRQKTAVASLATTTS
jgi:hypothetical protein